MLRNQIWLVASALLAVLLVSGCQSSRGDNIDAATGATLSSRAMAEGVGSAIRLVQERVGTPQRR